MSLEKSSIGWSAKQLAKMVQSGKIDFSHIVQRSYVWERSRKSALIESMILGYPIPPIFAKRIPDENGKNNTTYFIMDGKQRLSSIAGFLNDEYALTEIPAIRYVDDTSGEKTETDISGMKFSELPEQLQDNLNTVMISVTYFDNLTPYEERELFKRLNAGKPLSAKNKMLASCNDLETLVNMGKHPIFDMMLTEKARENKNQVSVIMKAHCMIAYPIKGISFGTKDLREMLEKENLCAGDRNALSNLFDMAVRVHDIILEHEDKKTAKKMLKETHFVSLVPFFVKAVDAKIDDELFANFIEDFYFADGQTSVSEKYNAACESGVAKNSSILDRHNALVAHWNEFFKS